MAEKKAPVPAAVKAKMDAGIPQRKAVAMTPSAAPVEKKGR